MTRTYKLTRLTPHIVLNVLIVTENRLQMSDC